MKDCLGARGDFCKSLLSPQAPLSSKTFAAGHGIGMDGVTPPPRHRVRSVTMGRRPHDE
ncbi:MAG: hypothetical protein IJX80_01440 [Clostridia bacterium]|nr:hypothetical protein [Clostridia bacterium]